MYSGYYAVSRLDKSTLLRALILVLWTAGLTLGFAASRFYGEELAESVLPAPAKMPSFAGLLAVNGLPLLISALAVFFHRSALFAVAALRGFSLGLMLMALSLCWGGGSAVMSLLLLFSALSYGPVLLWYWLRAFNPYGDPKGDTLVCCLVWLGVWAMDAMIVSPLLREIVIL